VNRYTKRTFMLEMLMVAVGIVFAFPVYVLVNLALRAPSDTSSPISPTTAPTLHNFTDAWREAGLGGALINSVVVTAVSVVIVLAVSSWPPIRWPAPPHTGPAVRSC
jgi:raffinose/stachyose/melibiose transport system permease protein